ncbi:CRISPR-associated protein Csx20 [Campylobacter geochelonis]|uniref:CRISPR-associated protein Csx20 n=1 Tax=Campylobacter geochelonis TaxID=1780362 RepID=UPI000770A5FA|nr:CRISPR-associated protein Csx20 [Campylobacter geochelonis]CZE46263.1 Uncharacterised protein [Campylobacter geochelonis]
MKLLLLFSHSLTNEQIKDAKNSLKITEFISLPQDLQSRFSQVPAELESLDEFAKPFYEFIKASATKGDFVLVQGDFGLSYKLVEFCKRANLKPVYATTKRDVVIDEDGVKRSIFKHVKFREY